MFWLTWDFENYKQSIVHLEPIRDLFFWNLLPLKLVAYQTYPDRGLLRVPDQCLYAIARFFIPRFVPCLCGPLCNVALVGWICVLPLVHPVSFRTLDGHLRWLSRRIAPFSTQRPSGTLFHLNCILAKPEFCTLALGGHLLQFNALRFHQICAGRNGPLVFVCTWDLTNSFLVAATFTCFYPEHGFGCAVYPLAPRILSFSCRSGFTGTYAIFSWKHLVRGGPRNDTSLADGRRFTHLPLASMVLCRAFGGSFSHGR